MADSNLDLDELTVLKDNINQFFTVIMGMCVFCKYYQIFTYVCYTVQVYTQYVTMSDQEETIELKSYAYIIQYII